LERPEGRIIGTVVAGLALMTLGDVILVVFAQLTGGASSPGLVFEFWAFFQDPALLPPFVPVLLPTALFARSSKEGAIAGFAMYLVPAAESGIPEYFSQATDCQYCGLGLIFSVGTPFLGLLVGAGGGAIGGWRAKRRAAGAKGGLG
jgi:hypothetical protein